MNARAPIVLLVVARAESAWPSVLRYSLLGLVLVQVSLGLALLTPIRFEGKGQSSTSGNERCRRGGTRKF